MYEGGIFQAEMTFPQDFPLQPPELKFISEMWHPNVFFQIFQVKIKFKVYKLIKLVLQKSNNFQKSCKTLKTIFTKHL